MRIDGGLRGALESEGPKSICEGGGQLRDARRKEVGSKRDLEKNGVTAFGSGRRNQPERLRLKEAKRGRKKNRKRLGGIRSAV